MVNYHCNFSEWPNWQGPGPRYMENMPKKIVVSKKKPKKKRARSRSPSKQDRYERNVVQDVGSEATMAYVKMVKTTFANYPEVYNAFVRILSEIKQPGANIIEIIEKVVLLFDGYPDLIFSFNAFLPQKYEIQIQDDAVVIRVYQEDSPQSGIVESAAPKVEFKESMSYIKQVKSTFPYVPEKFGHFLEVLDNFHSKKVDELGTIQKVAKLFQGHPTLILGFNQFLPQGYVIHMYDRSSYAIEYPGADGKPQSMAIAF